MNLRTVFIFGIFLTLSVLSILYYIGASYETAIEGVETTTTAVPTTTTLPYAGSVSIADMTASTHQRRTSPGSSAARSTS